MDSVNKSYDSLYKAKMRIHKQYMELQIKYELELLDSHAKAPSRREEMVHRESRSLIAGLQDHKKRSNSV